MKNKKYILFVITISFCLIFGLANKTQSKYVILDAKTAFHINKLMSDNIKPIIVIKNSNGLEKNLDNEIYQSDQDVNIDYYDNTKIDTAKYWYNEKNNTFSGDVNNLTQNEKITKEGWYRIVITDIFNNTNESMILIDKTPPNVTVKFYKKNQISVFKNSQMINNSGGVC